MLAGLDSPESAATIRMELQVARLQREFSHGEKETRDTTTQLRDIQIIWYSLGHLSTVSTDLQERFSRAERILGF